MFKVSCFQDLCYLPFRELQWSLPLLGYQCLIKSREISKSHASFTLSIAHSFPSSPVDVVLILFRTLPKSGNSMYLKNSKMSRYVPSLFLMSMTSIMIVTTIFYCSCGLVMAMIFITLLWNNICIRKWFCTNWMRLYILH